MPTAFLALILSPLLPTLRLPLFSPPFSHFSRLSALPFRLALLRLLRPVLRPSESAPACYSCPVSALNRPAPTPPPGSPHSPSNPLRLTQPTHTPTAPQTRPRLTPRRHPSHPRRACPGHDPGDAIRGGHPPPPPTHPKLARKAPPGASRVFWKKLLPAAAASSRHPGVFSRDPAPRAVPAPHATVPGERAQLRPCPNLRLYALDSHPTRLGQTRRAGSSRPTLAQPEQPGPSARRGAEPASSEGTMAPRTSGSLGRRGTRRGAAWTVRRTRGRPPAARPAGRTPAHPRWKPAVGMSAHRPGDLPVVVVNPRQVRDFARALGETPSWMLACWRGSRLRSAAQEFEGGATAPAPRPPPASLVA